jgi:hypothetical protein
LIVVLQARRNQIDICHSATAYPTNAVTLWITELTTTTTTADRRIGSHNAKSPVMKPSCDWV